MQNALGSRKSYAAFDTTDDPMRHAGRREAKFISARGLSRRRSAKTAGHTCNFEGGPAGFSRCSMENDCLRRFLRQPIHQHGHLLAMIASRSFSWTTPPRAAENSGRANLVDDDPDLLAKAGIAGLPAPVSNAPWSSRSRPPRLELSAAHHAALLDRRSRSHPPRQCVRLAAALKRNAPAADVMPAILGDGPLELVVPRHGRPHATHPRLRARASKARFSLPFRRARTWPSRPPCKAGAIRRVTHRYSIARDQRRPGVEIAVQREDEGQGGSRTIHQHYRLGQRLRVSMPGNNFRCTKTDVRPC